MSSVMKKDGFKAQQRFMAFKKVFGDISGFLGPKTRGVPIKSPCREGGRMLVLGRMKIIDALR